MSNSESFQRSVHFQPAFDKRHSDPKKNYGIHGVTLRMVLRGPLGATQFVLYTGWMLPHVTLERFGKWPHLKMHDAFQCQPTPADLGYHSPKPRYEGQNAMDHCDILGGDCYYDGSALNAEAVYERLLGEGDKGVWLALEAYYEDVFEKGIDGGFGEVLNALSKAIRKGTGSA